MTGTAVVLGGDRSPHATYFQVAGEAYRMPAAALRRAIEQSPSLHAVLMKYVQAFTVQTAHTAIANARATLVNAWHPGWSIAPDFARTCCRTSGASSTRSRLSAPFVGAREFAVAQN